jgi:hypothetical protein
MGTEHYSDSMMARDYPGKPNRDERRWRLMLTRKPPKNRADRRILARIKRHPRKEMKI